MKKGFLIVPLLLIILAPMALAQVSTTTKVRTDSPRKTEMEAGRRVMKAELEAKRAEADTKREAMRAAAESRRAEAGAKRVEFQQNIAKRKTEQTKKVVLATIERLEKIIVRLESRIAKVETAGGAASESKEFVVAAKVNLSDAKASAGALVGIDLSSEKARENFERIRAAAAAAREHIRDAHRNLMMAVRALGSVEQ